MSLNKRNSGVLLHISSLPSPYGIGSFGQEAYKFVDFLKDTGQKYWQVLPIGPTGVFNRPRPDNSPYSCIYSYGGNPYFIDLDLLIEEGLLKDQDIPINAKEDPRQVDYDFLSKTRIGVLKKAYDNFDTNDLDYLTFCHDNTWLQDYSLYMLIKEIEGGKAWYDWDDKYKFKDKKTISNLTIEALEDLKFWRFVQYKFFDQWSKLKTYANGRDIEIIGDLPIYVAMDSVDIWSKPDIFQLDEDLQPIKVSGVPPDYFSEDGQLWNNPLYNWEKLEEEDFKWWLDRIGYQLDLFDILRIDHFRAFESAWEIPYPAKTAKNGAWAKVPGHELLSKIKATYKNMPFIAEDLGFITQEVNQLRQDFQIPGMAVLQFAFDPGSDSSYLPHNHTKDSVVYAGTHDNNTFIGWLEDPGNLNQAQLAKAYMGLDWYEGYNWGMIRTLYNSVSNTAIIQAQDLLGLGAESRMNVPGTVEDNWQWRLESLDFRQMIKNKLELITEFSARKNN